MIMATLRPAMSNRASQTATNFDSLASMLFAASEPGAWYDPSDLSTMWQDSAGTTPVTAVEQPVGRMLDKSGRGNHATQSTSTKRPTYSRRVNLLTNSGFVGHTVGSPGTPPTGWVDATITGQIVAAPVGVRLSVSGTRRSFRHTVALSQGATIVAKASVEVHSGLLAVSTILSNVQGQLSGMTYFLDGIEVPQGTAVPVGVHDVVMTAVVATAGGSVSIDYGAGVLGNATGDVTIFNASLTLSIDAHLPYQWVNTATDYDDDPDKFPAYLAFDGVNRALATGNIDFTSTDKMTVFAGVTKLSDAAVGIVCELSSSASSNNGTFAMLAPASVAQNVQFVSRGTIATNSTVSSGVAAPFATGMTGVASISPPSTALRLTGAAGPVSTLTQGTGNYGNYPLYIGARAGTSLYFNGRLYGLIVRGAESTLSQIEATELYTRQKARLP